MPLETIILFVSFFWIALIYASVGFGGGSSYLALLAFMALPFEVIRPTALVCNIVVVSGGTYIFYQEGHVDLKKFWPFLVTSVPCAYLGGYWPVKEKSFFVILGITLIVAAFFLWFQDRIQNKGMTSHSPQKTVTSLAIGGSIGFLSGLVSIGGGIFLSPLLHLMNWDRAKKISALASLFILVNSISGLAGQLARNVTLDWGFVLPLAGAVLVGGQIGSRLGSTRFNALYIKRITALLIFIASIKMLW